MPEKMTKKRIFVKFIPLAALSLLTLFIIGGGYTFYVSRPVSSDQTISQFVVPRGQAVSVIAHRLYEAGLIRNPFLFRLIVKKQGLEDKLQAGSFQLSPSMTPSKIAVKLTQGTNDVWVTLLEGWRREQVAESFRKYGLENFDVDEFLNLTLGEEGQIFPDTYLFARQSTAQTIYQAIKDTFQKKVKQNLADDFENSKYSFDEVMTMASIVEREARGYEEMRHVAGILWHRYEIGMALQTDATLQYSKGYDEQTQSWWEPPLAADKSLDSPFNTYTHSGLPPHPICNPGLDAIRATLNPLSTADLFYLHSRDGEIHYGQTLEEHMTNIQKYLR